MSVTINSSAPFTFTLPDTATIESGEVIFDLEAALAEGTDDAADALAAAVAAQATADDAVPKSDFIAIVSPRISLINTENGAVYRMRMGFDGTFKQAQLVIDGDTTAVGACTIAVALDGVPLVLDDPLTAPIASAANFGLNTYVNPNVGFTTYQTLSFTVTSTNTSETFGTVTLTADRVLI